MQARGGKSISGSTKAQVESILRMCEKQKGGQSSWKREGEKSRKWGLKDGGETHRGGLVSFVRADSIGLYEMRSYRECFEQ